MYLAMNVGNVYVSTNLISGKTEKASKKGRSLFCVTIASPGSRSDGKMIDNSESVWIFV